MIASNGFRKGQGSNLTDKLLIVSETDLSGRLRYYMVMSFPVIVSLCKI